MRHCRRCCPYCFPYRQHCFSGLPHVFPPSQWRSATRPCTERRARRYDRRPANIQPASPRLRWPTHQPMPALQRRRLSLCRRRSSRRRAMQLRLAPDLTPSRCSICAERSASCRARLWQKLWLAREVEEEQAGDDCAWRLCACCPRPGLEILSLLCERWERRVFVCCCVWGGEEYLHTHTRLPPYPTSYGTLDRTGTGGRTRPTAE